jgi:tRNA nucleotidyltransferase (CCA-adding enzyme)
MQVYLVGGAVRDELLGRSVRERDWVVVGATPEQLLQQGYRSAGRDFPVFLHPESHEEYALARLERKTGPGYRGFTTEFSPAVSLAEDLRRRDLSINAMARAADGQIIDPYGGRDDLERRVLRHVSDAFAEDPVRILRVARFAARFAPLGFTIAPETLALMRRMVQAGEAAALVSERVWRELERALGEPQPTRFFEVLDECGALAVVMPELVPQHAAALAALALAARLGAAAPVRWAVLLADRGTAQVESLGARLRAPNEYRELALLAARLDGLLRSAGQPACQLPREPEGLMTLLEQADALRRPERFELWLQVLAIRAESGGAAPPAIAQLLAQLRAALAAVTSVKLSAAQLRDLPGPAIAAQLRALRVAALRELPASGTGHRP